MSGSVCPFRRKVDHSQPGLIYGNNLTRLGKEVLVRRQDRLTILLRKFGDPVVVFSAAMARTINSGQIKGRSQDKIANNANDLL